MYESSDEKPPRHSFSRKDKRNHCKGRIGIRHKYEWMPKHGPYRFSNKNLPLGGGSYWFVMKCSVCGRVSGLREQGMISAPMSPVLFPH